jgi:hypothetical protein
MLPFFQQSESHCYGCFNRDIEAKEIFYLDMRTASHVQMLPIRIIRLFECLNADEFMTDGPYSYISLTSGAAEL